MQLRISRFVKTTGSVLAGFVALVTVVSCQGTGSGLGVGSGSVTAENPEAVLSSPSKLRPDTLEAARHDRSQSKIAYVGAWAGLASQCKQIDTSVYDGFVVITPTSLRQFEEGCIINGKPLASNSEVIVAACKAEGQTYKSSYRIEMVNAQTMIFGLEGRNKTTMTRCRLPH